MTEVSALFRSTTRPALNAVLARVSLLTSTLLVTAGCFDAPPEYQEPTRIPPVIIMNGVQPSPASLYISSSSDPVIQFTVQFRADDAGQQLREAFVLDLEIGGSEPIMQPDVPPDPLGRPFALQDDRTVSHNWSWNPSLAGCHTMTAIIADQSNFQNYIMPRNSLLEARVTWPLWLRGSPTDTLPATCLQKNAGSSQ